MSPTSAYERAQRAIAALVCAGSIASSSVAAAQEDPAARGPSRAEFYGTPVLTIEGVDPEFTTPLPQFTEEFEADESERLLAISRYGDLVNEIEIEQGVWNESLVEELEQLGELYQADGDHANAIATYDRALYVTRIHNGLHTLEQVAIVNNLLDSFEARGDWEQVDKYEQYLFYTQLKAYGTQDARIIPAVQRLADWHLRAFRLKLGDLYGLHLLSAEILYRRAANLSEFHFEEDPLHQFVYNQRGIAKVAFLVLANAEIMREITHLEEPTRRSLQEKLHMPGRVEFALSREFQTGARALAEIADYYLEHELMDDYVRALVDQADWEIGRKRTAGAERLYNQARALLAETDDPVALEAELFANPVKIPVFVRPSEVVDSRNIAVVEIAFDLSIRGELANVEVLTEETEENILHLSKLKSDFRSSIYRPVLEDGKLKRARGLRMAFRYLY